jgi:F5/8 type C domain
MLQKQLLTAQRFADRTIQWIAWGIEGACNAVQRRHAFFVALCATLLFYLPSLRNHALDAGFLYSGDVLGFYWPSMVKMHALLSGWHFTAIYFSAFNGSSDFFLTSNFFGVQPFFVLFALLTPGMSITPRDIAYLMVVVLAIHSFITCYFSIKLLTSFFDIRFLPASFVAIGFAFSIFVINALTEPQFVFCIATVSWSAYAALQFERTRTLSSLVIAILPVLLGYLSGYIPLGVACLALSAILVATRFFVIDETPTPLTQKLHRFIVALAPFIAASIIVAPYLLGVYRFLVDSPSNRMASLFFSAHQLADLPQSILRLVSIRFEQPGQFFEGSVSWGLIAIAITVLFITDRKRSIGLSATEWKLLKLCAIIYFVTLLSTFGQHSVISDLVFYLVPQVGKMHIYQRFLLPVHLIFCLMVALMLNSVIRNRDSLPGGWMALFFAAATLIAAYAVGRYAELSQKTGVNNYIVFELLLAFLFTFALLFPGDRFIYAVAIVIFSLPALDRMYDYTAYSKFEDQQKIHSVALSDTERARIAKYLLRFSDKEIIKYVDLTPMWASDGVESFFKSFPYFFLKEARLSSYHGFNFYLSPRDDYMKRMPVQGQNALNPDWNWVAATGADFLVARAEDLRDNSLATIVGEIQEHEILRLPRGIVMMPLRQPLDKSHSVESFDNGYFRISAQGSDGTALRNIALGKPARQSSTTFGEAGRAVDGNTNGLFDRGSVTHTAADANAWWDLDLGSVQAIDQVNVWNRTDCCGNRLRNYWLFLSDQPFKANDTADILRSRPNTWAKINMSPSPMGNIRMRGAKGRYLRIQLGGRQERAEAYLSLAEVEVFGMPSAQFTQPIDTPTVKVKAFHTNQANYLSLDLESKMPAKVEYLLWNNPRLTYFLNGKRIQITSSQNLPVSISVPAGQNKIEIRYRHWPLTTFWILYGLYGLVLILTVALALFKGGQTLRHRKSHTI